MNYLGFGCGLANSAADIAAAVELNTGNVDIGQCGSNDGTAGPAKWCEYARPGPKWLSTADNIGRTRLYWPSAAVPLTISILRLSESFRIGAGIRCVFDGFVVGVIVLNVGLSKGHYRTLHLYRNLKTIFRKSILFGYAVFLYA